jgi:outer membrane protein assembly factor BamE (lipoprotein component of BamABCDE complex)
MKTRKALQSAIAVIRQNGAKINTENMSSKHLLLIAVLTLGLGACTPTIAQRGNLLDEDNLVDLKAGVSTREDVATKLGSPTQVSTFDEKTWYYIGQKTEQTSFMYPKTIEGRALKLSFNDTGVLQSIERLDIADARDIDPSDRRTPTYGRDTTFFDQLLTNLRRPIPAARKN